VDCIFSSVYCLIVLWLLTIAMCLISNHLLYFIYYHLATIYYHCPLSVIYCLVSSVCFLLTASLLSLDYSLLSAVLCFVYNVGGLSTFSCLLTAYIKCHLLPISFFPHSLIFHRLFTFLTAPFLPFFISFLW